MIRIFVYFQNENQNNKNDDDDEIQDFTLSNIRDLFVISKLKLILVFFLFFHK